MKGRKYFESSIVRQSKISNNQGYTLTNSNNLIEGINLDLFYDELMQGSGNELNSKFSALYSSSALAVNNFSIFKQNINSFSFLGYNNFEKANFERKFPTRLGGTPPNLDFVLENNNAIIAFESKYLEVLDKKKVDFKESYNQAKLSYLDSFWFELIDEYKDKELFLDVAQLIKHSIGLIHHKQGKPNSQVILVYIYWVPKNKNAFCEYKSHSIELENFENQLKKQSDIIFKSMTYSDLWKLYEDNLRFSEHFEKVKEKYFISI